MTEPDDAVAEAVRAYNLARNANGDQWSAMRAAIAAARPLIEREAWRPIEELEPSFGEVLGWSAGCGFEVVRSCSDGHRYAGAFTADWVKWWRPLPAPPALASSEGEG